jgi:hypothetical protein
MTDIDYQDLRDDEKKESHTIAISNSDSDRYRHEDDLINDRAYTNHEIYRRNVDNEIRETVNERLTFGTNNCLPSIISFALFIASIVMLLKYGDQNNNNNISICVMVQVWIILIKLLMNYYMSNNSINNFNIDQHPLLKKSSVIFSLCEFTWFIIMQYMYFTDSTRDSNSFKNLVLTYIIVGYCEYFIVVIKILVFTICIFFILCNPSMRATLLQKLSQKNGLTKEELNKLPELIYNVSTTEIDKDDRTCAICLDNYEENVILRQFECKHTFHKECIDDWLTAKKTCPLCRLEINTANLPLNNDVSV